MTWMDHALVLVFAFVWPVWGILQYRRFKERVRAGVPGARLAAYAETVIEQWLLVTAAAGLWIHLDRDWTWLGLRAIRSPASWLALAIAVLIGALFFLQSARIARRPETHEEARGALRSLVEMLPSHRSELTGFIALSVTAGVCEELLFRGVLGWYFATWLGTWAGHGLALVLFAGCHIYQGPAGAVRAFIVGGVLTGLYLWCGSLLPSMLLHASLDIASGWLAYEVLRERGPQPANA